MGSLHSPGDPVEDRRPNDLEKASSVADLTAPRRLDKGERKAIRRFMELVPYSVTTPDQFNTRIGKYRTLSYVGRGALAHIVLAEHYKTGERVAIKLGAPAGGGRYVTRFMEVTARRAPNAISPDEAVAEACFVSDPTPRIDLMDMSEIDSVLTKQYEILKGISSPYMVGVKELVEHDGRPAIVMDYVRGKTLREKIRGLEGIRLNWFLSLVKALERLKSKEGLVCHGDLKPENIIIKPSGTPVMIDLGIWDDSIGMIVTTPHFNPLLLRDERADVMAIGIMLYEVITGTLPFEDVPWKYAGAATGGETVRMSLSYFLSYLDPKELSRNCTDEHKRIIDCCLLVNDYGYKALREDLARDIRS